MEGIPLHCLSVLQMEDNRLLRVRADNTAGSLRNLCFPWLSGEAASRRLNRLIRKKTIALKIYHSRSNREALQLADRKSGIGSLNEISILTISRQHHRYSHTVN